MVHGLAEQSKGRLILSSRKGAGTTAEIWLPIATVRAPERLQVGHKPTQRQPSRQLSILVVDDDPLVLENAGAMLEDLGHRVMEARSGQEAIEAIERARSLDLVITDQAMPRMTGLELASVAAERWPHLPVILASGYAEIPAGSEAAIPRLSKPFDQATLHRTIEAALHEPDIARRVVALSSRARDG
jgi:CheY-like chemotaxis protein